MYHFPPSSKSGWPANRRTTSFGVGGFISIGAVSAGSASRGASTTGVASTNASSGTGTASMSAMSTGAMSTGTVSIGAAEAVGIDVSAGAAGIISPSASMRNTTRAGVDGGVPSADMESKSL